MRRHDNYWKVWRQRFGDGLGGFNWAGKDLTN